jgi:hypothetical protein
MVENWKDIKGTGGLYQISDCGRIRRKPYRNNFTGCRYKGMYCYPSLNTSGYQFVNILLIEEDCRKNKFIHRLVADAFIPNPNNYNCVRHKDGNRLNNHVDNLEWFDRKRNPKSHGCLFNAKKVEQYDKSGKLLAVYKSMIQANKETGVNYTAIGNVLHDRAKTAGGYVWKYAKE